MSVHVKYLVSCCFLFPIVSINIRKCSSLRVKADLARRMSRPLAALGGHNQSRHLHPFSVNHVEECARKCVVILSVFGVAGENEHVSPLMRMRLFRESLKLAR